MDSKILLGKILQRFYDAKITKVDGYTSFGYIKETDTAVYVTRENGKDTRVSFDKILIGIKGYQKEPSLYHEGTGALRDLGITHVNSPVWSLLHLLNQQDYE
jgi:hypothetical protein